MVMVVVSVSLVSLLLATFPPPKHSGASLLTTLSAGGECDIFTLRWSSPPPLLLGYHKLNKKTTNRMSSPSISPCFYWKQKRKVLWFMKWIIQLWKNHKNRKRCNTIDDGQSAGWNVIRFRPSAHSNSGHAFSRGQCKIQFSSMLDSEWKQLNKQ